MKNLSIVTFAAVALMAAALCSCKKNEPSVNFDHFEITYKIETNADCRECFSSDFEILINDKLDYSGAVTMSIDGKYENAEVNPNSTIEFRTVPEFKGTIPATLDFYLKYDITVSAINKEGEVINTEGISETRSYDGKIDLTTPEMQKTALADYTISYKLKSVVSGGKLEFVPAN